MRLAPIVLFCYNRPWHVRRTLESLKKNDLAEKSTLIVYSDGPKYKKDTAVVLEVRKVVQEQKWCGRVIIRRSKVNRGLAASLIRGITDVVNKFGSVIVLEDDLVLSPGFLTFMNQALGLYKKNKHVGAVSGYVFPLTSYPKTPFFLLGGNCWGWATWKRAWNLLETDPSVIFSYLDAHALTSQFNIDGSANYTGALMKEKEGKSRTWAIFWYGTQFMNGLYAYHPPRSLVQNIGFDGSGIHCSVSTVYKTKTTDWADVVRIPVRENERARKELAKFYRSMQPNPQPGFSRKIQSRFKNIFSI